MDPNDNNKISFFRVPSQYYFIVSDVIECYYKLGSRPHVSYCSHKNNSRYRSKYKLSFEIRFGGMPELLF